MESLANLVGVKSGPPLTVGRLVIHQLNSGSKRFRGQLEVHGKVEHLLPNATSAITGAGMNLTPGGIQLVEAKSAFEAIALVLRYGGNIVVNSRLLRDPEASLEAEDIRSSFRDFLEVSFLHIMSPSS